MKRFELEYKSLQTLRSGSLQELVAIGFMFPWSRDYVFELLENVAGEERRFEVEADELYAAVQRVRGKYGIAQSRDVSSIALWHSHPVNIGASDVDIREFPDWASVGFVYHTPTRTTSRYNRSGVIPPLATGSYAANGEC